MPIPLSVRQRPEAERAKNLRSQNIIPAVVYGHGFATLSLKIDYQTFRKVFEQATYSTIVTLDIESEVPIEGGKKIPVLIHEVQYDPITDKINHIDFYAVRMDEKVTTHIALEFVGESEAVKLGATLNTAKHKLKVSALPGDLVHNIPVDITVLGKIGDMIRVGDLKVPKGIEILDPLEDLVVSAVEIRVIEEAPAVEAVPAAEGAPAPGAEGEAEKGAEKAEEKTEEKTEGKEKGGKGAKK